MKFRWLGHSAFIIEESGMRIVIDPFLTGNPIFEGMASGDIGALDAVVLTHGHSDHMGDTVKLAKEHDCPVVGIYEVCIWLQGQGIEKCEPMNIGGTVSLGKLKVSLVQAVHSASLENGGMPLYMGASGGVVLTGETCTAYHAGDTDIFSDMALINRLYQPDVGMLPVGDRFTMSPRAAALACNEFFDFKAVIPMHYGTFPVLLDDPSDFRNMVTKGEVKQISPGETFEFER